MVMDSAVTGTLAIGMAKTFIDGTVSILELHQSGIVAHKDPRTVTITDVSVDVIHNHVVDADGFGGAAVKDGGSVGDRQGL